MPEVEVQSLTQFQPGTVSRHRQPRLSPGNPVLTDGKPVSGHWMKALGLLVKSWRVGELALAIS